MLGKDLLSIADLSSADLEALLRRAAELKRLPPGWAEQPPPLGGRLLALLFQKPSLRTRVAFEAAMLQLGGNAIYLSDREVELGEREAAADVGRVLAGYAHGIVARTFKHEVQQELAGATPIPVINGLSDREHPCQVLADLLTLQECFGRLDGLRVAYVGDGNNVAHSLILAAGLAGFSLRIATPPGFEPAPDLVRQGLEQAEPSGIQLLVGHNPDQAVEAADAVYTDVWYSMGQESERTKRAALFRPFQLNRELLKWAKPTAVAMHCLPAHRGEEITDEVLDGRQSVVLQQAENRLHVHKAVLERLLGGSVEAGWPVRAEAPAWSS